MIGENFEEFGWNLGDSPRWRFIGVLAPSQIPHWWEMKWEGSLYSIKAPLPPFVIFIPSSHKYALIAYSPICILSLILVKDLVVSEDVGHIDRTSLIFWCSIVFIFNSFLSGIIFGAFDFGENCPIFPTFFTPIPLLSF